MIEYSAGTLAMVNAMDYSVLMCSVYKGLVAAVEQAVQDKRRSRRIFCEAMGMLDDGSVLPGVGPVTVMKGKHRLVVLDADLWIEAIDAALKYYAETESPAVAGALRSHFLDGATKGAACGLFPEINYNRFADCFTRDFRFVVVAEAAARGLVDLRQQ